MSTPLDGIRVVEIATGIAGPFAGTHLADFGAEVIKVEPPGGDPSRSKPIWSVLNRGKQSVIADAFARGTDRVASLLRAADVCIAGGPIDALRGTVIDPDAAMASNARLVYLHTPPYTMSAPWAGGEESDALLNAIAGVSLRQGSFDGGPTETIYPFLVMLQGIWAAACAVAALIERERSGLGQIVTVAGVHGAMVGGAGAFTFGPPAPDAPPPRRRGGGPGGVVPFYRTYQCGDGEWLFLAALTPQFTQRAFGALGVSDIMEDERLGGAGRAGLLRPDNIGWITERIASSFRTRPRDEWLKVLADAGSPAGAVLDRDDWLDHPQVAAIGMRHELDDPDRGPMVMPGIALNLTGSPGKIRGAAPKLGELDAADAGFGRAHHDIPSEARPIRANGPLDGVRVLDLGAIIAGPFGASLLGDLGADVIKVEPLTGDSFRGPGFAAYNKGQRSVALDLRNAKARGAFMRLVDTADVVLDNYRPGVLARLGITYDDLKEMNPRVITLTITGFGEGGPHGHDAGFDPVLQAMSGMMRAQGGDSDPVFFTVPINDVAASASAALGACLALLHRERGGGGQRVWTSLAAMSVLMQAGELVRYEGRQPPRLGGRDHKGPTSEDRYYEVADGWVRAETTVEGPADLHRSAAMERLSAAGIRAAPARTATEMAADSELVSFGVFHRDPRTGREGWWTAGRHARFSRTELVGTLVSPALAEHARQVLTEAGLTDAEIDALIDSGAALGGPPARS